MADITEGLDPALQQALNPGQPAAPPATTGFTGPQGNTYATPAPRVPAPQVPAAAPAAAPAADDEPEAPEMDGVDVMANAFLNHLLQKDRQASGPAAPPGSFASKLQGAAGALDRVQASLGDAAAAPGEGGWLAGVARTMNARETRLAREKQQKFENDERLKNDQINLAKANIEMRNQAVAIQRQEKGIRDESAAGGEAFMKTLRDNYHVTDGITQDQLNKMLREDPKYLQTHTGRITGYEPVYGADGKPQLDQNGNPVESPIWSLADLAPGDASKQYTVTPETAKRWSDSGLQPVEAGTKMPTSIANQMDMRAQRYSTTLGILNMSRVEPLPNELKDQLATTLADPEVQHAISMKPGSALDGLYTAQDNIGQHLKAAQAQLQAAQAKKDPQATAAAQQKIQRYGEIEQNIGKAINLGFTDKERGDYAKEKEAAAKDAEKERHDRAQELIAQDKLKQLQNSTDPADAATLGNYLADGIMDPSQLSKRAKNYNTSLVEANKYSMEKYGVPFDIAQAQTDYKYANQKTTKDTLNMIKGMTETGGAIDIATNAAKSLPKFDEQTLNKVFNTTKTEFGSSDATNFHTAMLGLADEYSKVMGGGVATDTARQQSLDLLKDAYSKGQMQGAIDTMKKDIAARQQAIIGNNRYLKREYGGLGVKQPKIDDIITQGGQQFKVTSVDANGKVTGATPVSGAK